jgi:hypothetical protein
LKPEKLIFGDSAVYAQSAGFKTDMIGGVELAKAVQASVQFFTRQFGSGRGHKSASNIEAMSKDKEAGASFSGAPLT